MRKAYWGDLRLTVTSESLAYQVFEVSTCTLGILSPTHLRKQDDLALAGRWHHVPLRVREECIVPGEQQLGLHRYRLVCLDSSCELDQILLDEGQPWTAEHLQFVRLTMHPKLYVEARNLSSDSLELLEAVNVSRSGLLLKTARPLTHLRSFPLASRLMLRLDVAQLWMQRPLEPVCQVVRTYSEGEGPQTFAYMAVQFLLFTPVERRLWRDVMARLERHARESLLASTF